MKSISDQFINIMRSNGVFPPERLKADEKVHTYKAGNGAKYWYVLSPHKPVIGLFGQCSKSTMRRWAKKRKSESAEAAYQKKLAKLKKLVRRFSVELTEHKEPIETVDRRTTKLKQLSLPLNI